MDQLSTMSPFDENNQGKKFSLDVMLVEETVSSGGILFFFRIWQQTIPHKRSSVIGKNEKYKDFCCRSARKTGFSDEYSRLDVQVCTGAGTRLAGSV
jgi:hypothetical protein